MLADHPNLPKHNPKATITSVSDWNSLDSTVTKIIVDDGVSESCLTELDLNRFSQLKRLEIGDHCFSYVNELRLVGMNELESVVIGSSCFTKEKGYRSDPNRHLKNCPKLKSLKIGYDSFSDYSVCEIDNMDALEVIEMGDLDACSYVFAYGSLELKSIIDRNE